jgi:hypothetical protein
MAIKFYCHHHHGIIIIIIVIILIITVLQRLTCWRDRPLHSTTMFFMLAAALALWARARAALEGGLQVGGGCLGVSVRVGHTDGILGFHIVA